MTPMQHDNILLRHALFEHRRVKDLATTVGDLNELTTHLSTAARECGRKLWRFLDLFDLDLPTLRDFRFRLAASDNRLASTVRLPVSAGLLDDLDACRTDLADTETTGRLPAVCFHSAAFRGGMVLFAADESLPAYPHWHICWPRVVGGTSRRAVRVAGWREWVRWAVNLPPVQPLPVRSPGELTARDKVMFDFLASALGSHPTESQRRLLRSTSEGRWVVGTNAQLAKASGLSERQVRAAFSSLITAGLAERFAGCGDGAAWGVRLICES